MNSIKIMFKNYKFFFYVTIFIVFLGGISYDIKAQDTTGLKLVLADTNFTFAIYNYPKVTYPLFSFTLSHDGAPLIPINNGIFSALTNSWFKPQKGAFVQSLTPSFKDRSFYLITGLKDSIYLYRSFPKIDSVKKRTLTKLPTGIYNLTCVGEDSLYIWGMDNSTYWHIYFYNGKELKPIIKTNKIINTVIVLSVNSIMYSTFDEVIILQPNKNPLKVIQSKFFIESIAIDNEGNIYLSLPNGIYIKEKNNNLKLIVENVTGLLLFYNNKLFVLNQENNQILIIYKKKLKQSENTNNLPFYPDEKGINNIQNWELK